MAKYKKGDRCKVIKNALAPDSVGDIVTIDSIAFQTDSSILYRIEYADMTGSEFFPQIDIVCKLNPTTVNTDIVKGLSFLEPYGTDNPGPVFGFYGVTLKNIIPLSGGKHLKLQVSRENSTVSVLFFGCSENDFPYAVGDVLNLAVTLDINTFNHKTELAVYGKDICFADVDYEELLKSKQVYEDYVLGKPVTDSMKKELSVTRDDFVIVYKFPNLCQLSYTFHP